MAQELQRDQYLTVWAVSNEQMDRLAQLNLDEKYVMGYHINNLTYDVSKLKRITPEDIEWKVSVH